MRPFIYLPNSVGMVTTTGANDLVHTLSQNRAAQGGSRSAIITTILAYNNTGANVTLDFGTLDTVPAFHAYLPTLVALNGLTSIWNEADLPPIEFTIVTNVPIVAANERIGDIYVLASAATVLLTITVKEFGS